MITHYRMATLKGRLGWTWLTSAACSYDQDDFKIPTNFTRDKKVVTCKKCIQTRAYNAK